MKYHINEFFYSLQGEGYNTGKDFLFLRFSGCNLSCYFCDTEHERIKYTMTIQEVYQELKKINNSCQNLLITGGEPFTQNIFPLIIFFKDKGWYIAVESNGSLDIGDKIKYIDHLTISPKGKTRQKECHELRLINDNLSYKKAIEIKELISAKHHFISPMEKDGTFNYLESLTLLGQLNKRDKEHWYLSLQMHKLANIE